MADQVQAPESGGGEGTQSQPAAESTKIENLPVEVKTEQSTPHEVKEEVKQAAETAEAPKEAITADSEVKAEPAVKIESAPKDIKPEEPKEVKREEAIEIKKEEENKAPEANQGDSNSAVKVESNGVAGNIPNAQGDWQQRETELLKKIEELEKVKAARTQDSILLELKVREEEIDLLKARVKNLETELQAALSKPSGKNHEMIENIKRQHEELLSKARGMIFDKTKMVKNQELQIEALTSQIQSLKDINQITKDLLEIRNSEIKAMEDRLQAMEARFKAEKDRYGLVLERAQTSSNINDDLRKEYETQLKLFKELREKYDQRVQALVTENERLKASLTPAEGAPGTSG